MLASVTVICPNLVCRSVLRVPDRARGQKVRCCRCGKYFRIPLEPSRQPGAPAETETAPPPEKA